MFKEYSSGTKFGEMKGGGGGGGRKRLTLAKRRLYKNKFHAKLLKAPKTFEETFTKKGRFRGLLSHWKFY